MTRPSSLPPRHTIVAEVSKNWRDDADGHRRSYSDDPRTVAELFEHVIEHNEQRGYQLDSWRFSQFFDPQLRVVTETILAVFTLVDR